MAQDGEHFYAHLRSVRKTDAAEKQAKAFEAGVPTARVVRLKGAHYIFLSDEPGVLREMRAFLASLR